ncbi:MAG: hypothetical protein H6605_01965 [Flavobacteriales bacterium]|nr:hypothetical protein [Flavobacteriales bacterium]
MEKKHKTDPEIDLSIKDYKKLGEDIKQKNPSREILIENFKKVEKNTEKDLYNFSRALFFNEVDKNAYLSKATLLFDQSKTLAPQKRKPVLKAIMDDSGKAGSLFLIQNISALKKNDARAVMKDFLKSGGSTTDVSDWLQLAGSVLRKHNIKRPDTSGAVVDAIGDAASWVIDTIEDGVDAILEGIDAILDAITDAGAALVDLFEDVMKWTADQMANLLAAMIEAGKELGEFIAATFAWTYNAVSNFVNAAFEVGYAIADLLEDVVSESYFVLRRFVNGIIENLGPIGEILDFVLTQVENATSTLWRSTLLAIRYAHGRLEDALDWAANLTADAMTAIINAWESIGEALILAYEWAVQAGNLAWQLIGEATATIGNSIYYCYNFLTTTAVQFIFDYTRGLLRAGMAIAQVIGWAVDQSVEICGEIIRAALDIGQTIGQMLVEIALDPGNALNTFLESALSIGQTLDDLFQAAIIDTANEFIDVVIDALMEIGEAVVDMLFAVLRLGGALLADFIANLFNKLGTYRPLRDDERADAEIVFGNALDYELVFLSNEDPLNAIIFGIQDFFTKEPDSRAFVTKNLINFDVKDGQIDRPTLIHELTHVWQNKNVGGIYMSEAIIAQATGDGVGTSGYNYGYDDNAVSSSQGFKIQDRYDSNVFTEYFHLGKIVGMNGDTALTNQGNNINFFNPEMQGQIMMHWFVRTQLTIRDMSDNPVVLDASAWQPYRDFVRTT